MPAAINPIDDQLRNVLSDFPQIKLAVLFGSVASGTATARSDLDLAVIGEKPLAATEKIQIIEALAMATGRPIDLVDVHAAPEPLLGQVLKHGRRIIGSDQTYAQLLYRHLIEQADFVPLQNRILSERRMAWIGKS
jgi:predicted nucleotidyltransferase